MYSDGSSFYRRTAPLQNFFHDRELNQLSLQQQLNHRSEINNIMHGGYDKHFLQQYWHNITTNERKSEERNRQLIHKLNDLESQTSAMILQTEKLMQMKDEYFSFLQHHFAVHHNSQTDYQLTSPRQQIYQQNSSHVDSPEVFRMQENSESYVINNYGSESQQYPLLEQNQAKTTDYGLVRNDPNDTKLLLEASVQTEGFCCVFCGSDLAQRRNFSFLTSDKSSTPVKANVDPLKEARFNQRQSVDHPSYNVQFMQSSDQVQNRNDEKRYHRSNSCDISSEQNRVCTQSITRPPTSFGELHFRHDIIVTKENDANIANNEARILYKNEVNSGQFLSNSTKMTKAKDSELSSDLTLDDDSLLCSSSSEEGMLDREDTIRYIKKMCEIDKARNSRIISQRAKQKSPMNQNVPISESSKSRVLLSDENKYIEDSGAHMPMQTVQKHSNNQSKVENSNLMQNSSLVLPVRPKSKLQKVAHVHSPLASSVSENADELSHFREESGEPSRHNLMELVHINQKIDVPNFRTKLHLTDQKLIQDHLQAIPLEKELQNSTILEKEGEETHLQKTAIIPHEKFEQNLEQNTDDNRQLIQEQQNSDYVNKDKLLSQEVVVVSENNVVSSLQTTGPEETHLKPLPESNSSQICSNEMQEQDKLIKEKFSSEEVVSAQLIANHKTNIDSNKTDAQQIKTTSAVSESKEKYIKLDKKGAILPSESESDITDKEDSFFDKGLTATSAYQMLLGNSLKMQTSKPTASNSDTDDELEGELAAAVNSENTQKEIDSKILNLNSQPKNHDYASKTSETNAGTLSSHHSNEELRKYKNEEEKSLETSHIKNDGIQIKGDLSDHQTTDKTIENKVSDSIEQKKLSEEVTSKKPIAPGSDKNEPNAADSKVKENRKKFVRTRSKAHGLSKAARKALNLDPDSESDEEPSLALPTSIKNKSAGSDSDDFDFYD